MAAGITKESEALMRGGGLFFISKNPHTQDEARNILSPTGMGRPNPVQTTVLPSRGVETIEAETNDPAESLAAFLQSLRIAADGMTEEPSSVQKKK